MKTIKGVLLAAVLLLGAACGKDDGKTEGGKAKLDADKECGTYFEANQSGGNKEKFVAACKKDMSLLACSKQAKDSGFCKKANEDAGKKQIIDDMISALSTP